MTSSLLNLPNQIKEFLKIWIKQKTITIIQDWKFKLKIQIFNILYI